MAADQAPISDRWPGDSKPAQKARDRAFWIGLVVMVLSLVSGLATYLILTNLTPIVPRSDVVLSCCSST